jgi:hypothetical protein
MQLASDGVLVLHGEPGLGQGQCPSRIGLLDPDQGVDRRKPNAGDLVVEEGSDAVLLERPHEGVNLARPSSKVSLF